MCGACEQLFSGWEREFANKVFYPFVNGHSDRANYGVWLAKFCASLSWRTLSYMRFINQRPESLEDAREMTMLNGLEDFILGRTKNLGVYEQHLYPLRPIVNTRTDASDDINRYFLRNMHMDVLSGNGEIMVYTKMPSFIILGLAGHQESKVLRASRVSLNEGKIYPQTYHWPAGFDEYLFGKAKKFSDLYRTIQSNQ